MLSEVLVLNGIVVRVILQMFVPVSSCSCYFGNLFKASRASMLNSIATAGSHYVYSNETGEIWLYAYVLVRF